MYAIRSYYGLLGGARVEGRLRVVLDSQLQGLGEVVAVDLLGEPQRHRRTTSAMRTASLSTRDGIGIAMDSTSLITLLRLSKSELGD